MKILFDEQELYAFVESVGSVNVDDLRDFFSKFGKSEPEPKKGDSPKTPKKTGVTMAKHGDYFRKFNDNYKLYATAAGFLTKQSAPEAMAMNEIIDKILAYKEVENNLEYALGVWVLILQNVGTLNDFLKAQTFRLGTFNVYLAEIIMKLKKSAHDGATTQHTAEHDKRGGKYATC